MIGFVVMNRSGYSTIEEPQSQFQQTAKLISPMGGLVPILTPKPTFYTRAHSLTNYNATCGCLTKPNTELCPPPSSETQSPTATWPIYPFPVHLATCQWPPALRNQTACDSTYLTITHPWPRPFSQNILISRATQHRFVIHLYFCASLWRLSSAKLGDRILCSFHFCFLRDGSHDERCSNRDGGPWPGRRQLQELVIQQLRCIQQWWCAIS